MGGEGWQLIEPVDGFHMNQIANYLYADLIWDTLSARVPSWFGSVNPYNDEIAKIFGDQGGY
jgi:acyloxyacyl hydrolase